MQALKKSDQQRTQINKNYEQWTLEYVQWDLVLFLQCSREHISWVKTAS